MLHFIDSEKQRHMVLPILKAYTICPTHIIAFINFPI